MITGSDAVQAGDDEDNQGQTNENNVQHSDFCRKKIRQRSVKE